MKNLNRKNIGRRNNAQGHHFEDYIQGGCRQYEAAGIAKIQKTPEPFRTLRKYRDGTATVRFIANAEPDYIGCEKDGTTIVFEAKKTMTDRMMQSVITPHQWNALDKYEELGANAGVCIGIKDETFWIEWFVWKHMKELFGRKYITAEDVQPFKVQFNGSILFLNPVDDDAYMKELNRLFYIIHPEN